MFLFCPSLSHTHRVLIQLLTFLEGTKTGSIQFWLWTVCFTSVRMSSRLRLTWLDAVKWQNCYLYSVILRIWSRLILQKFLTPSDVVGSPFHSLQHESPKIIKLVSTTPGILRMQNLVNSSTIGLVCVWEREGERGYKGRKRIKNSVIYF